MRPVTCHTELASELLTRKQRNRFLLHIVLAGCARESANECPVKKEKVERKREKVRVSFSFYIFPFYLIGECGW